MNYAMMLFCAGALAALLGGIVLFGVPHNHPAEPPSLKVMLAGIGMMLAGLLGVIIGQ